MNTRLLTFVALMATALFCVIVMGALKPEPLQMARMVEPDHVSLPGIGTVYTFNLKGHWYLCNPRGDLIHATEFCPCHAKQDADSRAATGEAERTR